MWLGGACWIYALCLSFGFWGSRWVVVQAPGPCGFKATLNPKQLTSKLSRKEGLKCGAWGVGFQAESLGLS